MIGMIGNLTHGGIKMPLDKYVEYNISCHSCGSNEWLDNCDALQAKAFFKSEGWIIGKASWQENTCPTCKKKEKENEHRS